MSQTITPAAIKKTFTLRASPEQAFQVFTAGFGGWWARARWDAFASWQPDITVPRPARRSSPMAATRRCGSSLCITSTPYGTALAGSLG